MPVWIRGAQRVPRAARTIIAFVLPLSVAPAAAAEEPKSACNACAPSPDETLPAEPEATPSEQDVSEAPPAEAQGGAAPNFEPSLARETHPDAASSHPVPRLPPVSAADAAGAAQGPPLGLRLPTFIAFGIGGLGAGGAVVTHLAATAPYTDPKLGCNGRCADGSHTLGMTSTILAGLAVGALGTGVVLALSEPSREKKPLAPVLKMSVSPSRAAASASWAF
jgi:hypothetical protein